jgi:hypothetical protein
MVVVLDRCDRRQKNMKAGAIDGTLELAQQLVDMHSKTHAEIQQQNLPASERRDITPQLPFDSDAQIKKFFKDPMNVAALERYFTSLLQTTEMANIGLGKFLTVRYLRSHMWSDKYVT